MCAHSLSRNTCPSPPRTSERCVDAGVSASQLFTPGSCLVPPSGSLPWIFLPSLSSINTSYYLSIRVIFRVSCAFCHIWIPAIKWCPIRLSYRRAIFSGHQCAMWLSTVFLPPSCLPHMVNRDLSQTHVPLGHQPISHKKLMRYLGTRTAPFGRARTAGPIPSSRMSCTYGKA